MYAVLILTNGEWELHSTCSTRDAADQEVERLAEAAGERAHVFRAPEINTMTPRMFLSLGYEAGHVLTPRPVRSLTT
jgi:hypothetical protein